MCAQAVLVKYLKVLQGKGHVLSLFPIVNGRAKTRARQTGCRGSKIKEALILRFVLTAESTLRFHTLEASLAPP